LYKDAEKHKQNDHYNNYLFKHNTESEWIIIVDLDEFVYSRDGFDKISDYLKTVPENISRILLRWKLFGFNGHVDQPPSIIKGFTKRREQTSDVKTIARGDRILKLNMHTSSVSGDTLRPRKDFCLHLNHYMLQSYNWFMKVKATRGDGIRNEDFFRTHDINDVEDLELAQKRN